MTTQTRKLKEHLEHALDSLDRNSPEYRREALRYQNLGIAIDYAHGFARIGDKESMNEALRMARSLMREKDSSAVSLEIDRVIDRYQLEQQRVDTFEWD